MATQNEIDKAVKAFDAELKRTLPALFKAMDDIPAPTTYPCGKCPYGVGQYCKCEPRAARKGQKGTGE